VTLNTSVTAIKVEIDCEVEDWNNTGTGSGGDEDDDPENPGDDDTAVYTDLSESESANCYLVQEPGNYKFKAVIGNTETSVGNVQTVDVLWESFGTLEMPNVGDIIKSASYKDGYIRFTVPENFKDGNAVIAAKNSKGVVIWSWHIWCAEEGWKEQVYYNSAGTMMDRNLGALSAVPGDAGALGLKYQWGRKDPFLSSSSISSCEYAVSTCTCQTSTNGSAAMAEANPTTFFADMSLLNRSWKDEKTPYDPCPVGWRVPDGGVDGVWAKASGNYSAEIIYDWDKHGVDFSGIFGSDETIWYPGAGYLAYNDGILGQVGGYGYYWSCTPASEYAFTLRFSYDETRIQHLGQYRAYGFPVRCQKE
jgi:hypothetical protein